MTTHRRQQHTDITKTQHILLFADGGNDHYGPHVWTLKTELPDVPEEIKAFAREFYDCEDVEDLVDPPKIVETAGAWDDEDFCCSVTDGMLNGDLPRHAGFWTCDGAVVLFPQEVDLSYSFEG